MQFSRPTATLLAMIVFVALVALGAGVLVVPLSEAFLANAWFNGFIVAVLLIGVAINLRQVINLYRETRWLEQFSRSDGQQRPDIEPRLLSSMARMLNARQGSSLSPMSMRTLLDSIRLRLDESRDLSRYLIGLLVFLGLLGTFWGLLGTVGAVGDIIGSMQVGDSDATAIFERLKASLESPLESMGVAFSSSLFGLAGSLLLGFLDLQAGHAQNRFLNDLEEWLAANTRLSSGALSDDAEIGAPAYLQALLEQTAESLERLQRLVAAGEHQRERLVDQHEQINQTFIRLHEAMERQQGGIEQMLRQHQAIPQALHELARLQSSSPPWIEELRGELRLMSRTIANGMVQNQKPE